MSLKNWWYLTHFSWKENFATCLKIQLSVDQFVTYFRHLLSFCLSFAYMPSSIWCQGSKTSLLLKWDWIRARFEVINSIETCSFFNKSVSIVFRSGSFLTLTRILTCDILPTDIWSTPNAPLPTIGRPSVARWRPKSWPSCNRKKGKPYDEIT